MAGPLDMIENGLISRDIGSMYSLIWRSQLIVYPIEDDIVLLVA